MAEDSWGARPFGRGSRISNDDIYAFEPELARLYPGNRHIQPKIRQQLQVLRDRGLLKQPQRGVWVRI